MLKNVLVTCVTIFVFTSCYGDEAKTPAEELKEMKKHLEILTRHSMLMQFFNQQRVCSEGQSGVNLLRQRRSGTKNYYTETHSGYATAAIHDHANNIRTVGMGEISVVMNGVQFTTRHNDYRLYMPHRKSSTYGATEEIPFPDVPPAVLEKKDVNEQIEEMRKWFKAWRDQDASERNYTKYFKPVLCYLEGAWTKTGKNIDEPFSSDRHFIDASSWLELHDKLRFTAYSGSKSIKENFSFLPTSIIGMNGMYPEFAQWNYRILCNPLKRDLPLNRLRVVEDISSRFMTGKDINRHLHSRSARFQINTKDSKDFPERPGYRGLLDDLMEQIPGKNNGAGKLHDIGIDTEALNEDGTKKNSAFYHRWYKSAGRDAMGTTVIHRGYNDDYLFAAMTNQSKIAGMTIDRCVKVPGKSQKQCTKLSQKWTYAIPLEIIYLTPLSKWNPYNLKYQGKHSYRNPAVQNGRKGECTDGLEYNGTTSKAYYITPKEFYSGGSVDKSSADTTRTEVCVLDQTGKPRQVRAAGIRVFLPQIKDVGIIRQRYPIYPVHGEGSSVWKELNALREIVLDHERYKYMDWNYENIGIKRSGNQLTLKLQTSRVNTTLPHEHLVELSNADVKQITGGRKVVIKTEEANGHSHELTIGYDSKQKHFYYWKCGKWWNCWDKHPKRLVQVSPSTTD